MTASHGLEGRGPASPVPALMITGIAADGAPYPIEKMAAHRMGALHAAVSVFVFREDEALLIQRRALGKYHCGGLWANSCCSHPDWGESADACASRRLREELGLTLPLRQTAGLDYKAAVSDDLVEHERVAIYRGEAGQTFPRPDPEEVAETRWATLAELRLEAAHRPDRLAPWFRIYLNRWDELRLR